MLVFLEWYVKSYSLLTLVALAGLLVAFSGPVDPTAQTTVSTPLPSPTASPSPVITPSPTASPVATPAPTFHVTESKSSCNDLARMRDRISCRIHLATYDGYYEPEECRLISDPVAHVHCREVYAKIQDCRHLPTDEARWSCVKDKLGLSSIPEQKATCQKNADVAACMAALKMKVLWTVKFRFYNLEEKAERFLKLGLPAGDVVSLEVYLETQKQVFNRASTYDDQKAVLLDVRARWAAFVAASMNKLKSGTS